MVAVIIFSCVVFAAALRRGDTFANPGACIRQRMTSLASSLDKPNILDLQVHHVKPNDALHFSYVSFPYPPFHSIDYTIEGNNTNNIQVLDETDRSQLIYLKEGGSISHVTKFVFLDEGNYTFYFTYRHKRDDDFEKVNVICKTK